MQWNNTVRNFHITCVTQFHEEYIYYKVWMIFVTYLVDIWLETIKERGMHLVFNRWNIASWENYLATLQK